MACFKPFFLLSVALSLLALPVARLSAVESVAYQLNPMHNGGIEGAKFPPKFATSWSVDFGGGAEYPIIAEGRVFLSADGATLDGSGYGSRIYCLDLQTGSVIWGPLALSGTYFANYLAYDRGRLFAINSDGNIRAIDPHTGDILWQHQLDYFASAVTAYGGLVYASGSGKFSAVLESNGKEFWSAYLNGDMDEVAPTVSSNAVYLSVSNGKIARLAAITGQIGWIFDPGHYTGLADTVPYYRGRLYTGQNSGSYLLDTSSGKNLAVLPAVSQTPALGGDQMYYVHDQLVVTATDLFGKNIKWSVSAPDGAAFTLPPIYLSGYVIVANPDYSAARDARHVLVLDAVSGHEVWRAPLPVGTHINHGGTIPGMAVGEGHILVPSSTRLSAYTYPDGPLAPDYQVVQETGKPVSAIDQSAKGVPNGAAWTAFGPAAINESGAVSFLGSWIVAGIAGRGIFAADEPIAVEGGTTHLVDGSVFSTLGDPLLTDSKQVAFLATLGVPPFKGLKSKSQSLWLKPSEATAVQLIARTGAVASGGAPPIPGAPTEIADGAVFSKILSAALDTNAGGDATLAFTASLKPHAGGVKGSNNQGLWITSGTTAHLQVRTGDPVMVDSSQHTVQSIGALLPSAGTSGQGNGIAKGKVAVLLNFTDHAQAVGAYDVAGGGFVPAASTTSGQFAKLGLPSQSADGSAVAFSGTMVAGQVKTPGVFASVAGQLKTIALKGQFVGTDGPFVSFGAPVINSLGDTAFIATLKGANGSAGRRALVWVHNGTPLIVAQQGELPPGYDPGATLVDFVSIALPEGDGGPIFTAKVKVPGGILAKSVNSVGLWGVDSAGTVVLLLRTGQFAPGKPPGKTIQSLTVLPTVAGSYMQTRSFNGAHLIVVGVTYDDRSSEVATLTVPASFAN